MSSSKTRDFPECQTSGEYGYYSKLLNKPFDTLDELKAEEEKVKAEQARKEEAKALVKKDSDEVNKAFALRNEARKAYNEKATEAYKTYLETIKKAKEEYEASIKEVKEAKRNAEIEFDKKYREFDKNHPEGYRLILKDGDDVLTVDQEKKCSYSDLFEDMSKVFDSFFKIW